MIPWKMHKKNMMALMCLTFSIFCTDAVFGGDCQLNLPPGDLGHGIAAIENASGTGWILWSSEDVRTRFTPSPHQYQARHFVAVKYVGGQWMYDNNNVLTPFSPKPDDCLVAEVDFSYDSISAIPYDNSEIFGINSGIQEGVLSFSANMWNGVLNIGEFEVSERAPGCLSNFDGNLGHGVAAMENASGVGWIMWSSEKIQDRFSPSPHPQQGENFVAVKRHNGQWVYDNNYTLTPFSPQPDDCLVAKVNFTYDTVTSIPFGTAEAFGISAGIQDGLLSFSANRWNGVANSGEFELDFRGSGCLTNIIGDLGHGVAAMENASGTGWILWSRENVQTRFSSKPHPNQAAHFVAVKYIAGKWYYDNNNSLLPFSRRPDDCLVAETSFSDDSVTAIPFGDSKIFGIDSGIPDGMLSFAANQWNSTSNIGEFQLTRPDPAVDDQIALSEYQLVFNDEFNGSNLDPDKWDTSLLWGPYFTINNEEQMYVDSLGMHSSYYHSPFEFTGSTIKITATPTSSTLQPPVRPPENSPDWSPRPYTEYRYNGPTDEGPGYQPSDINYLSGIITSYESLKMTHGYVEMRAKLPAGKGLWPAFWLLTTHYVEDVPEIDIMEFLGQDVDRLYHTYHYFDLDDNWRKISSPSYSTFSADWTQDFHTFGLSWTPNELVFYVDGIETRRIKNSDYLITGQSMYLIANLAVGGNWPGAPDAATQFPASFEIDYIRAYERKLQPTLNLSENYQLMFEDNFNGSSLDPTKWNTSFIWGPYLTINNEEQYYVDSLGSDSEPSHKTPFELNNGVLTISARKADDADGFPIPNSLPGINSPIWTDFPSYQQNSLYSTKNYTSGIITSYDSFKFVKGYAEIRARVPKGKGLWPAFWLLNGYYVGQQPEIDIVEILGDNPHQTFHTFHRPGADGNLISDQGSTDNGNPAIGYADGFHTYGVRWQRDKLDWYIDGTLVHTYQGDDVPYQLMYVIVNLAVGGNWPDSPDNATVFPANFDIDYVRVYQERDRD